MRSLSALVAPQSALLGWLVLHSTCWTAFAVGHYASPPGDNIEQLNWAHSLEWGYWKHPPLPTWVMHFALKLGFDPTLTSYTLGHLCTGIGLWWVWLATRRLVDERSALCAVLLGSAVYFFSARGHFFNHNSAMLPWVGLLFWSCVRLFEDGRWRHFALLGLSIGAGTLVKYQMLLFLSVPVALWAVGAASAGAARRRLLPGALLACVVAAVVVAPHLWWAQLNQWPTLGYASTSLGAGLDAPQRFRVLLGFWGQQFVRVLPMLVALGVALVLTSLLGGGTRAAAKRTSGRIAAAIVLAPALGLVALVLLFGVRLQNHWGTSVTLLLIPILAVCLVRRNRRPAIMAVVVGVLVAHGLSAVSLLMRMDHAPPEERYSAYPSQALAGQALTWWRAATAAERPAVLVGPAWEAGAVSARMPGRPLVLTGDPPSQTPWIGRAEIERGGALLLSLLDALPPALPWGLENCIMARGRLQAPYAHGTATALAVLDVAAIAPGRCRE